MDKHGKPLKTKQPPKPVAAPEIKAKQAEGKPPSAKK